MKSTKKSFWMSVLAVVLCCTMLIGTTWAWFTDSVTSGVNRIQAGNLDVEMYFKNAKATDWKNVGAEPEKDPKFFLDADGGDILWEPGVVAYTNFKVENVGNLALKYAFKTLAKEYNTVDGTKSLRDVIKFAVVDGTQTYATREDAIAAGAGKFMDLESFEFAGSLTADATTHPTKEFTVIAYWEPNTNDNEYNLNNGKKADDNKDQLYINLEINLVATQLVNESDSFDNTYDAGAAWLGEVGEVPAAEDGVITITTPEQLAGFAKSVNEGTSYADKTIKLGSSLDLGNVEWPGINTSKSGAFTFDGNNKAIKNLKISTTGSAGLFTTAPSCTIKNLTIVGASVSGTNYAAAIVGHGLCTKVENCTVKNAAIVANPVLLASGKYDDGAKAGAIVGYLSGEPEAYVKGCTVSDTTIAAFRDLGGLVGIANGTSVVSGNTVGDNVKLSYLFAAPYDGHVNENMNDYAGRVADGATVTDNGGTATKGEANSLSTPADLLMLAAAVNSGNTFAGQTVKLVDDIDCGGAEMLPIGTEGSGAFAGIFDGNGKTVKNANISGVSGVGFIGYIGSGTLKNVTLENINTKGVEHVGVLVGYTATGASNVINCKVKNCSATGVMRDAADDSANAVGGIIGHVAAGGGTIYLTGNEIDGLTITGYRKLGALVGCAQSSAQTSVDIEGNIATNVTILQDLTLNNNPKGLAAGATVDPYVGDGVPAGEYRTDIETENTVEATILTMETDGLIKDAAGNYSITNANGMVAFANMVNSGNTFAGKTVSLLNDIDLAGIAWTPMAGPDTNHDFSGTFDGQNHTIKNLTVTNYTGSYIGFFSVITGATIKNVTFTNANLTNAASIKDKSRGGIIAGWSYACNIDNCHVENANITGSQKVGGILGTISVESANGLNNVTNCSVQNLTINSNYDDEVFQSGGLIGYISYNGSNANGVQVENNTVKDITINNDCHDYGNKPYYNGAFIGTIFRVQNGTSGQIKLANNTISGTNTKVLNIPAYSSQYFGWATTEGSVVPITIDGTVWTPAN